MFGSTEHIWQNLSAWYRPLHCSYNSKKQCKPQTDTNEYTSCKEILELKWVPTTNTCQKSTDVGRMNILLYALAYEVKGLQAVQLAVVSSSRILVISKFSLKWQHLSSICFVFLSAPNLSQDDYDRLFYLIYQDLNLRWYVFQIDWIHLPQIQRTRFCFHFRKINLRWFHDPVCSYLGRPMTPTHWIHIPKGFKLSYNLFAYMPNTITNFCYFNWNAILTIIFLFS